MQRNGDVCECKNQSNRHGGGGEEDGDNERVETESTNCW